MYRRPRQAVLQSGNHDYRALQMVGCGQGTEDPKHAAEVSEALISTSLELLEAE